MGGRTHSLGCRTGVRDRPSRPTPSRLRHGREPWVLVPKCMACAYMEARALEESPRPPDVWGPYLATDYAALGSRRQIRAVKRAVDGGFSAPSCYRCGGTIDVMGEGFRVARVDILEYFGVGTHAGRKPPRWSLV